MKTNEEVEGKLQAFLTLHYMKLCDHIDCVAALLPDLRNAGSHRMGGQMDRMRWSFSEWKQESV